MYMKINKELLKGSSELLVLSVLKEEPLYGYEIAKRIKATSSDLFMMGEGTLYPILHKLEQLKMLKSFWEEIGGRKRKYYSITKTGQAELHDRVVEWKAFSRAINAIVTS